MFTQLQAIAFAGLLTFAVAMQFAFSPRRRAIMGGMKFAMASAVDRGSGAGQRDLRARSLCGRVIWKRARLLGGQSALDRLDERRDLRGPNAERFLPADVVSCRVIWGIASRAVWSERLGR